MLHDTVIAVSDIVEEAQQSFSLALYFIGAGDV